MANNNMSVLVSLLCRRQPSISCDPQSALVTSILVEPIGTSHSDCVRSPQHLKVMSCLQKTCLFPGGPSEASPYISNSVFLFQMLAALSLTSPLSCSAAGDTCGLHLLITYSIHAMGHIASILFSLSLQPKAVPFAQSFTHSFIPQTPGTWCMSGIIPED